jgi:hexosaminidase
MSWRGIEGGIAAAQAQHDFVMSSCTNLYFDYYQSNDPAEPQGIGGYLPLDAVYGFDPVPSELTAEQARYMLGAQCQLWTEYVKTTDHLEYMLFPRMVALAEMAWTPQQQRAFPDFCRRLAAHEGRLQRLNVNFRPVAKLEQEKQFPQRKSHYSNE